MKIIEWAMRHRQLIILIVVIAMIFGAYSLVVMPKQEFPVFTIRQGVVVAVYPGASSEQVEEQIAKSLESYVFSYEEVDKEKTTTICRDGMAIMMLNLDEDINTIEKNDFWAKFKEDLQAFKMKLPQGVLALLTIDDFGETSSLLYTIESKDKTYRELEQYLDELEARLRNIESISKLSRYGAQQEQVTVYLDQAKLARYGMGMPTLAARLFSQGFTSASGKVENGQLVAPVHIAASFAAERDLEEQIVYADPMGNVVRLKDVARVVREYPSPSSYIESNGTKCVMLSIEARPGYNIVDMGRDAKKVIADYQKELPEDVHFFCVTDQSHVVNESVSTFLKELLIAIGAVILVVVLLMPMRVAMVSASTIPITIFISLGLFYLCGIELNTVTLAALLVTLGMIVDNSVVIVDCYMERLDEGCSRWHASASSATEFFKSILSATLAISITFIPFLFTFKGTFLDFILSFPWAISITLGISLLVAVLLVPYMQYAFIRKGLKQKELEKPRKHRSFLDIVQAGYEWLLARCFRHPGRTMAVGVLSVALGFGLMTLLPNRLFPTAERNQFAVEIYLPAGTALETTAQVADSLEQILSNDPRVVSVTKFVGSGSPRFQATYAPQLGGSNFSQFIVNTTGPEATEAVLDQYANLYTDYFPMAQIRFKQMDYCVAASPIEVELHGNNLAELKRMADSVLYVFHNTEGLCVIRSSYEGMLPGVQVDVNKDEANRLGINKSLLATTIALQTGQGVPITTLWDGDYPMKVVIRSEHEKEESFTDLENGFLPTLPGGQPVPVRQVASVSPDWTEGCVVRENGIRTLTISADVARGYNINERTEALAAQLDKMELPQGMSLTYGGSRAIDEENVPRILSGLFIAIAIIFFILLFHFKQINMALLVLVSMSLCAFGGFFGLWIMGKDFSLTAILGFVSLMGILVRNGIIMMDYAQQLRKEERLSVYEAAVQAAKRRMRPIFLTSAAASMGVVPMILGGSGLWSPMGTVICFGSLISMILVVTVLPVAYWLVFRRVDKKAGKLALKPIEAACPTEAGFASVRVSEASSRSGSGMAFGRQTITHSLTMLTLSVFFVFSGLMPASAQPKPLSLEECQQLALQHNVKMKNALLQVDMAKADRQANISHFFPSVQATGVGFIANKGVLGGQVGDFVNIPTSMAEMAPGLTGFLGQYLPPELLASLEQSILGPLEQDLTELKNTEVGILDKGLSGAVTAVQPVFLGGQLANAQKLYRVAEQVKTYQLQQSHDEVLLTVEKYYRQLIGLQEKQKTVQSMDSLLGSLLEDVDEAVAVGVKNRNDYLQVQLKANQVRSGLLQVRNGIDLSKMLLGQYIGMEPDSFYIQPLPEEVLPLPASCKVDHKQALYQNLNFMMLQKNVEANKLKKRLALGQNLPTVVVGGGFAYHNFLEKIDRSFWFGSAAVNIPISQWWGGGLQMKKAKLALQEAENLRDDTGEMLVLQMQQYYNQLEEYYEQVQVSKESIETAEENYRMQHDAYEAGLATMTELLNASSLLQQSREQYSADYTHYMLKRMEYLYATGQYGPGQLVIDPSKGVVARDSCSFR